MGYRRIWVALLLCAVGFSVAAAPMPFDVFSHLYVGMREPELLRLAGSPDFTHAAVAMVADSSAPLSAARDKQYGWKANSVVPYATLVSVRVGAVVAIERDPDF